MRKFKQFNLGPMDSCIFNYRGYSVYQDDGIGRYKCYKLVKKGVELAFKDTTNAIELNCVKWINSFEKNAHDQIARLDQRREELQRESDEIKDILNLELV
jgi:hypothetical protein